jgi:hypothetical protein
MVPAGERHMTTLFLMALSAACTFAFVTMVYDEDKALEEAIATKARLQTPTEEAFYVDGVEV